MWQLYNGRDLWVAGSFWLSLNMICQTQYGLCKEIDIDVHLIFSSVIHLLLKSIIRINHISLQID